jgi:hypothetical protein
VSNWTRITALAMILTLIAAGPAEAALKLRFPKTNAMKAAGEKVAKFVGSFTSGYILSKIVDDLIGQDFESQLNAAREELATEIDERVKEMEATSGESRMVLQAQLEQVEAQLMNLDRATAILKGRVSDVEAEVALLKADQAHLEQEIEVLERRTSTLERRVEDINRELGELDARVSDLELALISECLDLRSAPLLGVEGFRAQGTAQSLLEEHYDSERLTLKLRGYLNSCTADLTQRGLLLQLSWITRSLDRDMVLYATFKHIEPGGFDRTRLNQLTRLEYPLYRPVHRVDGQVLELFIPYAEIPFPSTNRFALALVVTHDGELLYTLPDRVITCHFGQRAECRWGR